MKPSTAPTTTAESCDSYHGALIADPVCPLTSPANGLPLRRGGEERRRELTAAPQTAVAWSGGLAGASLTCSPSWSAQTYPGPAVRARLVCAAILSNTYPMRQIIGI